MSGNQDPGFFDFSFPALAGSAQPPAGDQAAANPFGVSRFPQAASRQPQQQPQVQLQQPVKPASSEPLTARSTVVHASSKAAAPRLQQQQQQGARQVQAAPPKPVPITQVSGEHVHALRQGVFCRVPSALLTRPAMHRHWCGRLWNCLWLLLNI